MARTEVTGLQIKDGSVSLTADVVGILPVANGGTGSNTLALNNVLLGNGTGALQAVAPGASGNVLTSNGTSWVSAALVGVGDVTLTGTQTLTNKTISGASNTITNLPASATPDAARKVREHGTSANNWYKIVTYSPGAVAYARLNVVLVISSFASTGAIISVTMGNNAADQNPTGVVEFLSKGNISVLADNAFKIVANGYGQPIELWVQTVNSNGSALTYYESSRYGNPGGVAYDTSQTAVTTEPVGTVLNARSAGVVVNGEPVVTTTGTQTLTNKTLTNPVISILKDSGNNVVASFIGGGTDNYLQFTNRTTYNPHITATGNSTNIDLGLNTKGTGVVMANNIPVVTTTGTQSLTNKTISGASNTITNLPASATPDAARLVCKTVQGGIDATTGPNTWAKIATFSTGTNQFSEGHIILSVVLSGSNNTAADSAIIAAKIRTTSTDSIPAVDVKMLAHSGGVSLGPDSFKIIAGAWTSNAELWMRKNDYYGIFSFYELNSYRSSASGITITYHNNATWQEAVPTGANSNVTTNGVVAGNSPVVTTTGTQTLTNKTLTSPAITTPTGIVKGDVGLGSVDNTADAAKAVLSATKLTTARTINGVSFDGSANITVTDSTKQATSEKGQANGYASLDSGGKVPVAQLPNSIMEYQGTWNASTNTPTLANGTGSPGDVYRVSVAGTALSLTFEVGDYAIYNGSTWEKSDTTDAVASVAGRTGNVTLTSADVGLGNVDNTSNATERAATATLTNKTLTSPRVNQINDTTSGLPAIVLAAAASSVNYVEIRGTLTGQQPQVRAQGTDTNIDLLLVGKGTGGAAFYAFTGNDAKLSVTAADANANLNLIPKGTGVVQANGVPIVTTTGTQSLTNKTLTSPAITTPTGIVKSDVGLANVDNTSDATKNAAAVALTNKTSITSTGVVTGTQLVSTVATGSAPLSIASTTICPNLNATYVGGLLPVTTATGTSVAARDSSANLTANAFTSTVATGTAPFTVASTTNVANLNASYLQGYVGNTGAVASTFALRDANANLAADNFINTVDSTVTAAGTTTLTAASAGVQVFTGTTTQTVLMPTGVVWAGQKWTILNQSTGALAIQSSTGAGMFSLPAGYAADVTCLFNTPTTALHWRGSIWAQTAGLITTTSNTLAAFSQSTTNAIGVGTIELGHATDTTLSRSAAGTLAVEGVNVLMTGGALGTPSSGTLTNCTFPTLNQNTTGSAATLTTARTIGGVSFNGSANIDLPGVNTAGTQNTTGTAAGLSSTLAVGSGGTGSTTLTLNNVLLGNGTSALQAVAPGTTGNVLTSNGTTWTSAAPTGGGVSRVTSTITTATTLGAVANTEYLAYIASGGSVTLPTAVGNTSLYTLKNTDTTTKTVTTVGDDASFASVTALLRGNGDDASTVFTDSSGKYTWTGAANVRLSTAVKKFGTASIYFGAGGNNANINASTLPGMGAGDFTIEMWFYSTVAAPTNGYYLYDPRPYTVNGVYTTMYVTSGQKLTLLVSATARITGTTNITTNTWHHAALCRSGGVTRLFLNGVQEGSDYADTNNYLTGAGAYVGNTTAFVNGVWAGYVDDVRVTQGAGRYTANFTPPTAEFPITQLIDGNYPLVLAPNQAIELASSGSNWSVVSDAAPIPALTTTPTSATTTTLTVASTPIQVFTGTTTHTVKLPSTGIVAGRQFTVINNSTGLLTMQTSTAAQIHVLASGTESILTALIDSPTTAAHWEDSFIATNFAAGKALTVNNSLTLAGTDGTTMTFPGATDTVVTLAAAQTLTNKTLTTPTLTTPVINSTPTGTGVATAATASTLALRDANANLTADNFINVVDSTVTAAGTTTLTIASGGTQVFTGTTTQTVLLPTTGIVQGQQYTFINNSTGAVTVRPSGGVGSVATMLGGGWVAIVTATASTPTTTAHWTSMQVAAGTQGVFPASGSVLSTTNATSFSGKTFDFGSNTITGTLAQFNTAVTDADLVSLAGTETLTNKRITPRVVSVASSATPAINTDNGDLFNLTSLATNVTSMTTSLTGTPTDGQRMVIRIKSAANQTIAWGTSFTSSGVALLPTATVATKTHLVGFIYDSVVLKWVCVASDSAGY